MSNIKVVIYAISRDGRPANKGFSKLLSREIASLYPTPIDSKIKTGSNYNYSHLLIRDIKRHEDTSDVYIVIMDSNDVVSEYYTIPVKDSGVVADLVGNNDAINVWNVLHDYAVRSSTTELAELSKKRR